MSDNEILDSPKKPRDILKPFFSFNAERQRSVCQVPGCTTSISGKHTSNLEKHIFRRHPNEANLITAERCKIRRQELQKEKESSSLPPPASPLEDDSSRDSSFSSASTSTSGVKRGYLSSTNNRNAKKKKGIPKLSITMTKEVLMDAFVDLVTENGRPLSIVEDSGMRKIIDPILDALNLQQLTKVAINRKNVISQIRAEAACIRNTIKEEVKERLVCLKIDTATRLGRSILGANIQFCHKGKIVLRTLCVKELTTRHTAVNLERELSKVLADFGITAANIYSQTTDNAANMIATSKRLSKSAAAIVDLTSEEEEQTEGSENEDSLNEEDVNGESEENEEEEDEDAIQERNWQSEDWAISILSTLSALPSFYEAFGAFVVHCGAHTLQLAIEDVFKDEDVAAIIGIGRKYAKKLRTPTIAALLKTLKLIKPSLDNDTRWLSILKMILDLLKLRKVKCALLQLKEKDLPSEGEWKKLEEVAKALGPAQIATKKTTVGATCCWKLL